MRPVVHGPSSGTRRLEMQLRIIRSLMALLAALGIALTVGYFLGLGSPSTIPSAEAIANDPTVPSTAPVASAGVTTQTGAMASSTSSTSAPTTTMTLVVEAVEPPPPEGRYVVPPTEAVPDAKQVAVDVAYHLTTYAIEDDPVGRLYSVGSTADLLSLAAAVEPLTYPTSWSRGEILYPQMGGLEDGRASVMVVVRQTVGSNSEPDFSVVRTLDIRLRQGGTGWEFDSLESAGGTFDSLEDLELAHEVAADPRIEMPDSARLDIRAGLVSPRLLRLMSEIADRTEYGIAVLATGHPTHVFGTDRLSHHTLGRAVDIYRVGDRLVVDDRNEDSATRALAEWLYAHQDVTQVGSPWELDDDDPEARRSFTDVVHLDHIHVAVRPDSET